MKIIYNALFDLYASILKNGEYVCVSKLHIYFAGLCGVTTWETWSSPSYKVVSFFLWLCVGGVAG